MSLDCQQLRNDLDEIRATLSLLGVTAQEEVLMAMCQGCIAEIWKLQSDLFVARKERDAAHAHACEASLEERDLRRENERLTEEATLSRLAYNTAQNRAIFAEQTLRAIQEKDTSR